MPDTGSITIRAAEKADAAAIAKVHVDSWRSTYAGILPDDLLLGLSTREHESRWWRHVLGRYRRNHYVYVAEDAEEGVVGFGSGGPSRESGLPYRGEIYTLYLRDEYHGQGVGRDLFRALIERSLSERGPSLIVWVLAGNPTRFFYEALGGKVVARRPSSFLGAEIEEIGYGWDDVTALVELGGSDRGE